MSDVLKLTDSGLYCERGDFYVDPWRPVERALITHGHADHARSGCKKYLSTPQTAAVMRKRIDENIDVDEIEYEEPLTINGTRVSFHPAGHILGSAQIRIEDRGHTWVVSGDYKRDDDRTCESFTPIKCDVFITESTFGLPIYHWPEQSAIFEDINRWWSSNADEGVASVVFVYGLGKAQRLLSGLDASTGPIFCHGAVEKLNGIYRDAQIDLPPTEYAGRASDKKDYQRAMILAPPSAQSTSWMRKFGKYRSAFASGWMMVRGRRRRRNVDRGFILSDHADWNGLLDAISATEAQKVLVTHGYQRTLVQYLNSKGIEAAELATQYEGELDHNEADEVEHD